jgi:hypothetical protein
MMRFITAIMAVMLLAGCETHRTSSVAVVTRDAQNRYEIRLDAAEWSMGGPCNFPQFPHRLYESHWIYTDRIEGEVSTNHLVLTFWRGATEYPWIQETLRGSVVFTNKHMHVALQLPYFRDDNTIERYVPYELNGDYKLEMR